MWRTLTITSACLSFLTLAAVAPPSGAAAPSGFSNFGNAQDTINVILNGAAVYPLSGCKVTGVEGLNNSNIDASGSRIDPTRFDTVYVDISCRGG
jgi:hypothetical protein